MSTTKAIYAGLRALGIEDEDDRRDLYHRVTAKRRLRDMSPRDKSAVVQEMRQMGFKPKNGTPAAQRLDGPFARKLQALWLSAWNLGLVRDRRDRAIIAFAKRQTGVDHPRFLRHGDEAQKVIAALEGWMTRDAGVEWPVGPGHGDSRLSKLAVIRAQCRMLGVPVGEIEGLDEPAMVAALSAMGRSIRARNGAKARQRGTAMTVRPDPPAHVAPYVRALGTATAVEIILDLGGCEVYLPQRSSGRSMLAGAVGTDRAEALAREIGPGYVKIPLARKWVAQVMKEEGHATAAIARKVRADVATVRRWLNGPDPRQLDMFETAPPAQPRG